MKPDEFIHNDTWILRSEVAQASFLTLDSHSRRGHETWRGLFTKKGCVKHASLLLYNTHSKLHTETQKTESRTSNVRLRLFEFSVNIRNFVAGIPKKLWNKRMRGNEHSVNNSEKCNKTYSKTWFKTPSSSRIQVRKRFHSRSKNPTQKLRNSKESS